MDELIARRVDIYWKIVKFVNCLIPLVKIKMDNPMQCELHSFQINYPGLQDRYLKNPVPVFIV